MDSYETIFITTPDLTQDKIDANVEKVKQLISAEGGKIVAQEFWGRKKLSYPIKRNRDGFYVYLLHTSPRTIPALLDRHFRLTETILRGLTVKVDPRTLEKVRTSVRAVTEEASPSGSVMEPAAALQESQATQKKEDSAREIAKEEVKG